MYKNTLFFLALFSINTLWCALPANAEFYISIRITNETNKNISVTPCKRAQYNDIKPNEKIKYKWTPNAQLQNIQAIIKGNLCSFDLNITISKKIIVTFTENKGKVELIVTDFEQNVLHKEYARLRNTGYED